MGGGYWDPGADEERTVLAAAPGQVYSAQADAVLRGNRSLHQDLNPHGKIVVCDQSNPIVIAIDVTGSMGNWSKILYDKLPMFYGQILLNNYLDDPALSFAGVGDANSDRAPLQVTPFAQGRLIEEHLRKLWLEGGGGGQNYESYELAAYFYARRSKLPNSQLSFLFFTGDEGYYPAALKDFVETHIGDRLNRSPTAHEIFEELKQKYQVFFLHKRYYDSHIDQIMVRKWEKVLGKEYVLHIEDPKAVVDIMLGTIAIVSGARTLEQYIRDMMDREQSEQRMGEVNDALRPLYRLITQQRQGAGEDSGASSASASASSSSPAPSASSSASASSLPAEESPEIAALRKKLEALRAQFDSFPPEFRCPITQEPFVDPVLTEDGHTYERTAITEWFADNSTSPITGKELGSKMLIPNHALRNTIAAYCDKTGGK